MKFVSFFVALLFVVKAQPPPFGPPRGDPPQDFNECLTRMESGPPDEVKERMQAHHQALTECLQGTTLAQCTFDADAMRDLHEQFGRMFTSCMRSELANRNCNLAPSDPPGPPPGRPEFGNNRRDIKRQMINAITDRAARQCFLDNRPPHPPRPNRVKRHPPPGHGPGCFRPFCNCSAMDTCENQVTGIKQQMSQLFQEHCRCLTNGNAICEEITPPQPPPCQ